MVALLRAGREATDRVATLGLDTKAAVMLAIVKRRRSCLNYGGAVDEGEGSGSGWMWGPGMLVW